MKRFFNHFLVAIGAFASMLTMVSFFFSIKWNDYPVLTWIVIAIIVLACLCYASLQVSRTTRISIKVSENFQLIVKEGNLFDQKGVIVIPVNDFFDTHVGDGIIDSRSVHGQFINKLFLDRVEELDHKIEKSIHDQGLTGVVVDSRVKGKSIKYPLGTCVDIMDGGNKYICVVTTEFDGDNVARLSKENLSKVVYGLFAHLEIVAGCDLVNMPVIGAGNARLNRSTERILHYLIDYFDFSLSDRKILGGVQILIPSLKDINLNRIESIFGKSVDKCFFYSCVSSMTALQALTTL